MRIGCRQTLAALNAVLTLERDSVTSRFHFSIYERNAKHCPEIYENDGGPEEFRSSPIVARS